MKYRLVSPFEKYDVTKEFSGINKVRAWVIKNKPTKYCVMVFRGSTYLGTIDIRGNPTWESKFSNSIVKVKRDGSLGKVTEVGLFDPKKFRNIVP